MAWPASCNVENNASPKIGVADPGGDADVVSGEAGDERMKREI
jgi:hypothetical protein